MRGLNRRHLNYLLKDPIAYPAMIQSIDLHQEILQSLRDCDWALLGRQMCEYMHLRELMDPNACSCDSDVQLREFIGDSQKLTEFVNDLVEVTGCRPEMDALTGETKVLWFLPKLLSAFGIIHGGSLTGAMGGGMFLAPLLDHLLDDEEKIRHVIRVIRRYVPGLSALKRIHYEVDHRGIY